MTLVDFLLARIAEDHDAEHDPRRRADCATRRAVVKLGEKDSAEVHDYWSGWNDAYWQVLALLAQPYANHPDYRDEWRP